MALIVVYQLAAYGRDVWLERKLRGMSESHWIYLEALARRIQELKDEIHK